MVAKSGPPGVKSKQFGCLWKGMFIVALGFPERTLSKRQQTQKIRHLKAYYASLTKVLPCKFCRDFCRDLERTMPLQFSSRRALMYSIYRWKDEVNKKLRRQEQHPMSKTKTRTKRSPPFAVVEKKYLRMTAKCSKTVGRCV